jgi:hypothetical protein
MTIEEGTTIGQQLQNWLIRNNMDVTDALVVTAVGHAFANEIERRAIKPNPQQPCQQPNQN